MNPESPYPSEFDGSIESPNGSPRLTQARLQQGARHRCANAAASGFGVAELEVVGRLTPR